MTYLCMQSDHLLHDTVAVFISQKHLTDDIKNIVSSRVKWYFTDGSSSQYDSKNKVVNVCYHVRDFG